MDLTYVKLSGESNGAAGAQYTGLDAFGRVIDQRWTTSGGKEKGTFCVFACRCRRAAEMIRVMPCTARHPRRLLLPGLPPSPLLVKLGFVSRTPRPAR